MKQQKKNIASNKWLQKAQEAECKKKIHEEKLKKKQLEAAIIDVDVKRGELIPVELAKNSVLTYLKKANLEIFRIDKKLVEYSSINLQHKLEADEMHEFNVGLKKMFEVEVGTILSEIIEQVKKEVKELKK